MLHESLVPTSEIYADLPLFQVLNRIETKKSNKPQDQLKLETLQDNLRYDKKTGLFWWIKPGKGRTLNKPAGHTNKDGYCEIRFEGVKYFAHRLAWFITYGFWPNQIDHKDRNPSNNRFNNLRYATPGQNAANRSARKGTAVPYKGVHKHHGKYRAAIKVNGVTEYLGRFNKAKQAAQAYKAAAEKYFGEFAHAAYA